MLFGSHPEFGFLLAMDDEVPAARMLVNAVEWQLAESAPERPSTPIFTDQSSAEYGPERVRETSEGIRAQVASLREEGTDQAWLRRTRCRCSAPHRPRCG